MCKLSDLRQTIVRLESSGESAKLEHANALKKCAEDGDRALVESAEQFKAKLIVEYQKFETLSEKYKVRTMNCRETALGGYSITGSPRRWEVKTLGYPIGAR